MSSLAKAVPGVANAFLIMVIIMCIYAILAVEFFADFGNRPYPNSDPCPLPSTPYPLLLTLYPLPAYPLNLPPDPIPNPNQVTRVLTSRSRTTRTVAKSPPGFAMPTEP